MCSRWHNSTQNHTANARLQRLWKWKQTKPLCRLKADNEVKNETPGAARQSVTQQAKRTGERRKREREKWRERERERERKNCLSLWTPWTCRVPQQCCHGPAPPCHSASQGSESTCNKTYEVALSDCILEKMFKYVETDLYVLEKDLLVGKRAG